MICTQKRVNELATRKDLTEKERIELITLLRNGGYDMPDCMFENAYLAYRSNPSSDQSTSSAIQSTSSWKKSYTAACR